MKKINLAPVTIGMIYAFGLAARAEEAAPSASCGSPSWKSKGVKPPPPVKSENKPAATSGQAAVSKEEKARTPEFPCPLRRPAAIPRRPYRPSLWNGSSASLHEGVAAFY